MLVPLVSSNPKLGTSFGGLGAYVTKFDPASRVSIFGAMYQYTSTDSSIGGVIARTSFAEDHHRLTALAAFGVIKNDYRARSMRRWGCSACAATSESRSNCRSLR